VVTDVPATAGYEHFPHGADVGLRGYGPTRAAAFEQAALALTAAITDPARIEPREPVAIRCSAPDDEMLLVEWLNELVYAMSTLGMLFSRFRVRIRDGELVATAWGEPVDPARHQPAVEIKGATYTALDVREEPDGRWVAECVVDV
jgi:tRNA nucleotidyltransferase (CCA-adding enzyme)